MLSVVVSLTSCLKDDTSSVTYYNDTAITAFSLTTVNTYVTSTNADGTTTTTKSTLTSKPAFVIDQYKHEIYNLEKLPSTCDLKHVLATITTKNNGQIAIKSVTSDSLWAYSSTDSIDFSVPREIRVYAMDGSDYRAYTVTMNVADTSTSGVVWDEVEPGTAEIPDALYQETAIEDTEDGFRLSTDNGLTWTDEIIGDGENPLLLPESDFGYVKMPYNLSVGAEYELLVGKLEEEEEEDEAYTVVWRKLTEGGESKAPWIYMELDSKNTDEELSLPSDMGGVSLVWFNSQIYAIGRNRRIYKTRDWGLTWRRSQDIKLPSNEDITSIKAATDESGRLWIRDLETERVWRGTMTK